VILLLPKCLPWHDTHSDGWPRSVDDGVLTLLEDDDSWKASHVDDDDCEFEPKGLADRRARTASGSGRLSPRRRMLFFTPAPQAKKERKRELFAV
jgi:hypothetical protein